MMYSKQKALAGALVYWWAWFYYKPVCKKKIIHKKGHRTLRRTYVLERLEVHNATLTIKKSLHAGSINITGASTLRLGARIDVGDLRMGSR